MAWVIALCVVSFVIVFKFITNLSVATTVLYITLVLMSANVFKTKMVISVALACLTVLSVIFVFERDYENSEAIGAYLRCVVSLSAITFLAVRSKRIADSLRRNQAYMVGAQRLSRVGSVGFKVDQSQIVWSEEAANIFEYPANQQPTMLKILARVHPDDRPLAEAVFEQASRHEPRLEVEHRLLMADGRVKHIHLIANPLLHGHDGFEYVGAVMDVTDARQAREQLLHSQAQLAHVARVTSLGELAASIAHEVNQPLAAIRSSGEACYRWLDRPVPDIEEVRQSVDRMVASSIRASEVIQRLRTLAQNREPECSVESFNEIVNDTLVMLKYELSAREVRVPLYLGAEALTVDADRIQVQQVVLNLIINACQAMAELPASARVLTVRTFMRDGEAVLEVSDCGPGIEPQALPLLFNPFFTTKSDGLGMGLSICRSIVDCHQGRLWATNNAQQGAVFSMALPISHREVVAA
jgi:signal transduction histidine kinase